MDLKLIQFAKASNFYFLRFKNYSIFLNSQKSLDLYNSTVIFFQSLNLFKKQLLSASFLKRFKKQQNFFIDSKIWFYELELVGLGYRISLKNNNIRLNLGFSHVIFLPLPVLTYFVKRKSKILIYSLDKFKLSILVTTLLNFKRINMYKFKGLKLKSKIFKFKPGKRTK